MEYRAAAASPFGPCLWLQGPAQNPAQVLRGPRPADCGCRSRFGRALTPLHCRSWPAIGGRRLCGAQPAACYPPTHSPTDPSTHPAQDAARAARKRRAGALIEGSFLEEEPLEGGEGEGAAGEGGEEGGELAVAERRYAAELARELKVGPRGEGRGLFWCRLEEAKVAAELVRELKVGLRGGGWGWVQWGKR